MIMRNNAIPEHMTSLTLPCIATIEFVVIRTSRLGNPANSKHAVRTHIVGKMILSAMMV